MIPRVWSRRAGAPQPPPGAVYVGRPTKWGNPIPLDRELNRMEVLARYRTWLLSQPALMKAAREELRGKDLVCWCAPRACHADVLLEIANEPSPE